MTLPQRTRAVLAGTLAIVLIACASGGSPTTAGSERSDRARMDTLEFRNKNFRTIFDAIQATHAEWLLASGGTKRLASGAGPEQTAALGIFIGGQTRSQPVEYLTRLTPEEVSSVRRISASEALATYGWSWTALVITLGH